jgi:exopolysaccharide production protein ExoZ
MHSMEGLRGVAVFLVFLVHYITLALPWLPQLAAHPRGASFVEGVRAIGHTGVDLFFVLSGYLIYGALLVRPQPFVSFMGRRVRRLYPAFLVVFALYLALALAMPGASRLPRAPAEALLYIGQNLLLLPGLFPIEPLISVAWSLSYEMFYYLALPAVVGITSLRGRSAVWRSGLFLALAAALFAYCMLWAAPVRLTLFVAGIVVWELIHAKVRPLPQAAVAGLLLLAGAWVYFPGSGSAAYAGRTLALCIAYGALCHLCFSRPGALMSVAVSWTPLRWLGNMSYSYYLLHGLALQATFTGLALVVPPPASSLAFGWAFLPLAFALTLLPSAVLYLAIERPFSLLVRKPQVAPVATPAS